jgi:hypothetical protein
MRAYTVRLGLVTAIAMLAAFTFTSAASADNTAPPCKAHSSMKKACYPKTIAGTFSGESDCYSWTGKISTRRHHTKFVYYYGGTGSFDWQYKPSCMPGCTPSTTMGTLEFKPNFQINRNRNPGEGWFYTGDDHQTKLVLGNFSWDCGDGPRPPEEETLVAAFAAGGQSRGLKTFKGTQNLGTVYKWSLKGHN